LQERRVLSVAIEAEPLVDWVPRFRQQRLLDPHAAADGVAPARRQELVPAQMRHHAASAVCGVGLSDGRGVRSQNGEETVLARLREAEALGLLSGRCGYRGVPAGAAPWLRPRRPGGP